MEILAALVAGLIQISRRSGTVPPGLTFTCSFQYRAPGSNSWIQSSYTGAIERDRDYAKIDTSIGIGTQVYSLYVYYDGSYSAINFVSADQREVFNADAEVELGKMFSFFQQSPGRNFDGLNINCRSNL